MSKILLFDANNLLVRSIHAAKNSMTDQHGNVTGGFVIFVNLLSKYIRENCPDKIMLCWDSGPSTYRRDLYPAYKAARVYSKEQSAVFDMADTFTSLANIPSVKVEGVEADDIIASYVRRRKGSSDSIIIVSGDKDFNQLISTNVNVLAPGAKELMTMAKFKSIHGIPSYHYGKVLALMGDVSDNIPGVPGVGPKTAFKLLAKHDMDIEAVLAEPKLAFEKETVRRNFALIDLINERFHISLPPIPDFSPTKSGEDQFKELIKFLYSHQIASIANKLKTNSLWS